MCFVAAAPAAAAAAGSSAAVAASSPSWLTIASVASSALGLGAQVIGQIQQTNAQNAQAQAQAQIARNNAATAQDEAAYALEQSQKNAAAQRRKTAEVIGAQRAKEGGTGAVVDSGSFMDVTLDTAERGEMDALALLNEGKLAAWRATNQGKLYTAQSQIYDSAQKSAMLPAAGTLLAGAGQIGSNYYNMVYRKTV
jgi:hypothetical protein